MNNPASPDPRVVKEIFFAALDHPTPEGRAAFLGGACGENRALRHRVERLLAEHFEADSFLQSAAADGQITALMSTPLLEGAGTMVGRYKLLERIGEGGFGEVWMADQREPVKRRVALKIIKLGMDSKQVVARFEAERQALAMMDHANIAKIFDAGTTEAGRPYFVMELVRGVRITDYCDQNQLPTRERLRLFILVCQAIQHAHQKGIIHRDIKPSNILVTLHDGVAVPKVIDFGIAKATQQELTNQTVFTQFQQFIGTPAYISPEQAEMSGLDIDTRADIYSLGVLLYELLVGQTPFDAREMARNGIDVMRRIIREAEPPRPSTRLKAMPGLELTSTAQRRRTDPAQLNHQLRGDLDWIVMKCLEKDRTRRYHTANGLAMDLQRYLDDEPVVARPPSMAYRTGKLIRRHRLAFATSAVVFLALVFGVSAVITVQHRANEDYRRRLYVSEVNRAGRAWQAGQSDEMRTLLERCPAPLRGWEWKFLHQQLDRWEQKVLLTVTNLGGVALAPGGDLLVVGTGGVLQVRDFPSGQWLRNFPLGSPDNSAFALGPRDDLLATADSTSGAITLWNLRTGDRIAGMSHPGAQVLAWSNDGRHLASGGHDGTIRYWEAAAGRQERAHSVQGRVLALAYAPDDRTLAVGTVGKNIQILDVASGSVSRTLQTQGPYFYRMNFSPDGRKLAAANGTAGGFLRDNRVWSLEGGGSLDLNTGAEALWFSFAADSRRLVIGDATGMIQVWDLERRVEVERFSAHLGAVHWVHLLPDDRILSAGRDGLIKVFRARRPGLVQLKGYSNSLRTVAFSPDSRWLAAAGLESRLFVWDVRRGGLSSIYTNHAAQALAVAFSPDGYVASADAGRTVRLWDPVSLETRWATSLAPALDAWWVAFSPDGRRIYASSRRDTLTVLDAATGQAVDSVAGLDNVLDGLAVSPDGRLLALCQKVRLSVRRADDLHELWQVPALPNRCAAFSPDGKWIATGDQDGVVRLWEVASEGRVRRTLPGHAASVSGVGFHPDGSRLVSCDFNRRVKVWDWRAGVELLTLQVPGSGQLWHAAFSPDGRAIAVAGGDGVVSLWRVE